MATTLEKIKTLLSISNKGKTYKVKMYAEAILDDGRVVATEDETLGVGSEVYEISDDGEAYPLEAGTYTLDSGEKLIIDASSVVESLGEEVEEEVEEMDKTEMSSQIQKLKEENDSLKNELEQIELEPAVEKFSHNPELSKKQLIPKKELLSMTTSERVKYMINNKLTRI